jgi:hypothetical protein
MTLFKYDKKDICKDMCYDKKKMQIRVERFLLQLKLKIELSSVRPVLKEEVLCRMR